MRQPPNAQDPTTFFIVGDGIGINFDQISKYLGCQAGLANLAPNKKLRVIFAFWFWGQHRFVAARFSSGPVPVRAFAFRANNGMANFVPR